MKELMVLAFIITAPATGASGTEEDAYKAIAEASYKQSGLENMVNHYVELQLRHIPKQVQTVVGNTFLIGKMIQERKASYTWTY